MAYIISYGLLIATIYCSFKLATEKMQNKIVWPILTALLGPGISIIQYLVTTFAKKRML